MFALVHSYARLILLFSESANSVILGISRIRIRGSPWNPWNWWYSQNSAESVAFVEQDIDDEVLTRRTLRGSADYYYYYYYYYYNYYYYYYYYYY